jgi:uncharacterized iron-regulated membrane protein
VDVTIRHFRAAPSWRRIALFAGVVAGVELVLLVVAGISLIAQPVQSKVEERALEQAGTPAQQKAAATAKAAAERKEAAAKAAADRTRTPVVAASTSPGKPSLHRTRTAVLVLNGVGTPGAAARTAEAVAAKGYKIGGITNAATMDYTRTTIMYRPGFRAEAARLGADMRVKLVGPLDGMRPRDLSGAQLVVIVGA